MKLLTHTAVGMFFGAVFYYLLNLDYWFYFVVGFSAFIPVGGYLYDTISFANAISTINPIDDSKHFNNLIQEKKVLKRLFSFAVEA